MVALSELAGGGKSGLDGAKNVRKNNKKVDFWRKMSIVLSIHI